MALQIPCSPHLDQVTHLWLAFQAFGFEILTYLKTTIWESTGTSGEALITAESTASKTLPPRAPGPHLSSCIPQALLLDTCLPTSGSCPTCPGLYSVHLHTDIPWMICPTDFQESTSLSVAPVHKAQGDIPCLPNQHPFSLLLVMAPQFTLGNQCSSTLSPHGLGGADSIPFLGKGMWPKNIQSQFWDFAHSHKVFFPPGTYTEDNGRLGVGGGCPHKHGLSRVEPLDPAKWKTTLLLDSSAHIPVNEFLLLRHLELGLLPTKRGLIITRKISKKCLKERKRLCSPLLFWEASATFLQLRLGFPPCTSCLSISTYLTYIIIFGLPISSTYLLSSFRAESMSYSPFIP